MEFLSCGVGWCLLGMIGSFLLGWLLRHFMGGASDAGSTDDSVMPLSNNPNDLKVVEGIGPKIEELLKDGGINTWAELAQTDISRLQEILDAAGSRFKMHDPKTWPEQAEYARDGKWAELEEYQEFLIGGK